MKNIVEIEMKLDDVVNNRRKRQQSRELFFIDEITFHTNDLSINIK
jgi:hypothetical protein